MRPLLVALLCLASATCLAAPQSRIWPGSDEGAAWMIESAPNLMIIGFPVGTEAKGVPEGTEVIVEVPAYIELFANAYVYSAPMPEPAVEDVLREGAAYRRYTFAAPRKDGERWARFFTHWTPRPGDADRAAPGVFAWRFDLPDGPEAEQSVPIKLLPALPEARPPQRMFVHFWSSSNCNVPAEKLGPVVDLLTRCGVNLLPFWEAKARDLKAAGCYEKGARIVINHGGMSGWPQMGVKPEDPRYANRDHTGKPVDTQDLQWVIDGNGAPWATDLQVCKGYAGQCDVMAQDIEWQPIYDAGFSEAGIEAFARRNGLNPAALTPQSIWTNHRRQWGDFRAEQYLTCAGYYTKAAREGNPNALTVWLPGSPYTTTDPDLMSDMIPLGEDALGRMVYLPFPFPTDRMQEGFDILQPMWYGHGVGQVREALEWTRAITRRVKPVFVPLFLGQGREFYYTGGDSGPTLRAMAWAAVLGGAQGYGYWLTEFSPLQFAWIARTNRELARLEDALLDGEPDPAGVSLEPMPKKQFTLVSANGRKSFPVPDSDALVLWRAYSRGASRLVGVINLDPGVDAYARVKVEGLPEGEYGILDVSENTLTQAGAEHASFTAQELAEGVPVKTPAGYGVTLLLIAPAGELAAGEARTVTVAEVRSAYEAYREPDTEGAVLAERSGISVRYDITPDGAQAILIDTPNQSVWLQPGTGAVISDWVIKQGDRRLVQWLPPHGGAAMDLFWSPAEAHWSGDEKLPYELVYAKVHGSKAHVRLRQAKQTPALQGLVLTKTFIIPEEGADIQVKVDIENVGPAPVVGFSYWPHHTFPVKAAAEGAEPPALYLETTAGLTAAPLKEIVWAKPGAGFTPGNDAWETGARNGETTGEWIAQYHPDAQDAVICQSEGPGVTQFYSWRSEVDKRDLSVEWMYPHVELTAGAGWSTSYTLRYVRAAEPGELTGKLLKRVP